VTDSHNKSHFRSTDERNHMTML